MATRIDILKGKPEKAVMNIAIPIFVYLLISNSYNIVDGMWITGIGKDAIAAIGAVMPLYMIITGVGMGIGTGATTCYLWFISLFGANDGTAVFAAGNKLYYLGIMPISATCMALVPVVGNAFGEQSLHKIKKAFRFACILSVSLGFVIMVGIYIFAEPLSFIFAYTTETSSLLPGLVEFVRTTILCLPFLGIGLPSTFLYQGLGRGFQSLCWTFIRELLSSVLFIYLFGYHFSMGLSGVWLGLLTGRTVANILNYIAAKYTINHLPFPAS